MNRPIVTAVALAALVLLAGCTGAGPGTPSATDSPTERGMESSTKTATPPTDTEGEPAGTFALYVSDRPNAIEKFRHLNVTVDSVVLVRAKGDATTESTPTPEPTPTKGPTANATATATESTTETATATATPPTTATARGDAGAEKETEDSEAETEDTEERERGRIVFDVEERTVDLTGLLGDNASLLGRFEIPTGRYATVHLEVSEVEATLTTGESANVKLPSEKLQITKPFEVTANESVDFVFDIAVHKAGKSGKYILRPVISESGTDVPIDPIDARSQPDDRGREDEGDRRGPPEDRTEANETGTGDALSLSFLGNVTPGANVTIEVARNGTPVANATVTANDGVVGTTDSNGRLTFAVPSDAESLSVEVEYGEAEVEREFEFGEGGDGERRDDEGRDSGDRGDDPPSRN